MEESVYRHRESARYKVRNCAFILEMAALLFFIVSLFAVPFPFVRQIWLQSTVGAMGFVNCGIILWLSSRIRQLTYPAAAAGLGLVFHEQLLALRGFLTLRYHSAGHPHDAWFLIGNFVLSASLAAIFFKCPKPLEEHSRTFARDFYIENHKLVSERKASFQASALIESGIIYGFIILALWHSQAYDLRLYFSVCKLVGELTCINAFYGAGRELDIYFREMQKKSVMLVKVASHLLVMCGVLWFIYRVMPIEPFLR